MTGDILNLTSYDINLDHYVKQRLEPVRHISDQPWQQEGQHGVGLCTHDLRNSCSSIVSGSVTGGGLAMTSSSIWVGC